MSESTEKNLQEFEVPGVHASVPDPVTAAGGQDSSKASKKGKPEMPLEKIKALPGDLSALSELFDGSELSEDFKEKAHVIFEAALNDKVSGVVASLEEQYEEKLSEEVAVIEEALVEKIDSYLDYVVEQWVEENRLAIESGIKAEVVESFMSGLKGLFSEHYIDVPDEKVDVLAAAEQEVSELGNKLSDAINENIELSKKLLASEAEKTFVQVSEGLAATQVEKFRSLAEGIDFDSINAYSKKLNMIKESYFPAKKVEVNAQQQLNEEVAPAPEEKAVDPVMRKYADAISRSVKK